MRLNQLQILSPTDLKMIKGGKKGKRKKRKKDKDEEVRNTVAFMDCPPPDPED